MFRFEFEIDMTSSWMADKVWDNTIGYYRIMILALSIYLEDQHVDYLGGHQQRQQLLASFKNAKKNHTLLNLCYDFNWLVML